MDQGFFRALPFTATSPFALVAYIITLFVWLFLAYQSRKLNNFKEILKSNKEGKSIDLAAQLAGMRVPAKMSAEEFIRAKRQEYIFWAVLALIVALVAISIANIAQPQSMSSVVSQPTVGSQPIPGLGLQFAAMRDRAKSSTDSERVDYLASLTGKKVENWTGWVDGFLLSGSRIKIDMDAPGPLSVHDIEFDLPPNAIGRFATGQRVLFSGTIDLASSQSVGVGSAKVISLRIYLRDASIQLIP